MTEAVHPDVSAEYVVERYQVGGVLEADAAERRYLICSVYDGRNLVLLAFGYSGGVKAHYLGDGNVGDVAAHASPPFWAVSDADAIAWHTMSTYAGAAVS